MSDADEVMNEADQIVIAALQSQCDHPMATNRVCRVCGMYLGEGTSP